MRFGRLFVDGKPSFASLDEAGMTPLSDAPWASPHARGPARTWSAGDLLPPVTPSKIVCIGRNYVAHANELGNEVPKEPLLFLKPPSAIVGHGGVIVLPAVAERVEHEAELGVIIGRRCRSASRAEALESVFGFTCVGDITARDLQRKDGQWTRAKGFDSFCPVGPWIETDLDTAKARVVCRVNGATRQEAPLSDMIFDVPTLISYVSAIMTLEPGDLLVTGTPEGVGPLTGGDRLEVEITGLGVLEVSVAG